MELTEEEMKDLKLIQHNMALEGHMISMEDLIEMCKQAKAEGDDEKIVEIVARAKTEGISYLEAIRKYLLDEGSTNNE